MVPFFSDERAIYGALKAASNGNLDTLYSVKSSAEGLSRMINMMSFLPLIIGIGLCFTIIGIPVALLLLGLFWFLRSKNTKFKKNLANAYSRCEQELLAEKEQLTSKNQDNDNN